MCFQPQYLNKNIDFIVEYEYFYPRTTYIGQVDDFYE